MLKQLDSLVAGNELGQAGVAKLAAINAAVQAAGVSAQRLKIDAVIARGLDYYTGTIYETFLDALPDLGSVCSGGRYDNLAALYTNQQLPGIGASLGLGSAAGRHGRVGHARQTKHAGRNLHSLFRRIAACTIICGWPPTCGPPASAWKCFPNRKSSDSN